MHWCDLWSQWTGIYGEIWRKIGEIFKFIGIWKLRKKLREKGESKTSREGDRESPQTLVDDQLKFNKQETPEHSLHFCGAHRVFETWLWFIREFILLPFEPCRVLERSKWYIFKRKMVLNIKLRQIILNLFIL